MAADRIDLVDEHDGRRLRHRLAEQVPHATGPDTDEHLDEVRSRQAQERHTGLARDGPCEQRLAGARGADEQHPLRDACPETLEAGGVTQVVDDLPQLTDRLVGPRDVSEGHLAGPIAARRARPTEPQRLATSLHLQHEPDEDPDDQERREQPEHDVGPDAAVGVVRVGPYVVCQQVLRELLAVGGREDGPVAGPVGELPLDGRRRPEHRRGADVSAVQPLLELVQPELLRTRVASQHRDRCQCDSDEHHGSEDQPTTS